MNQDKKNNHQSDKNKEKEIEKVEKQMTIEEYLYGVNNHTIVTTKKQKK